MIERFSSKENLPTEVIIERIETLEAERDAIQGKIDAFFHLLKQRHLEASPECGEVDDGQIGTLS